MAEDPQRSEQPKARLCLANRLALRPKEAAEALGVSEGKLRQMLPDLPHVRLGTAVVLPVEGLRAWLKEHAEAEKNRVDESVDEVLRAVAGGDRD